MSHDPLTCALIIVYIALQPGTVFDWTSVLFASPLLHCWILPSVESSCVVPKNLAGLSTHTVPGSPLTFLLKSPTNLVEISIKGEVVAPHHTKGTGGWSLVSSGHPLTIPCRHNRPDVSLVFHAYLLGNVVVSSVTISAVVPRHSGSCQKLSSYPYSTSTSSHATS